MRRLTLLLSAAALALAGAARAQTPAQIVAALTDSNRPPTDVARDDARKPGAMIAFAGLKPGARVAELIPGHGYFTRLFAVAVKPGGAVIAIVPPAAAQRDAAGAAMIDAIAADPAYGDVSVVKALSDPAVRDLDLVWTSQNYHDLHNSLPPEAVIATNKVIFAALKPGGSYIVVDHAAVAGSGLTATNTLHRIDPAVVKAEGLAAGFVFDGENKDLANPADPHTANVFDPSIRGKTDQFVYKFRKPK